MGKGWMQEARINLIAQQIYPKLEEDPFRVVVRNINCNYLLDIYYPNTLRSSFILQ